MNRNCKVKDENIFLIEKNKIISDKKTVRNIFNKYFINVAENLATNMGTTTVKPGDYLTSPNASNFFVTPTDSNEVFDILNNLDPTKSCDIYGISPRYVTDARGFLSESLAELFNNSIEDHCFPNDQKFAKVLSTHKGKSKLNDMNYRPISVLPLFSKVLD